MQSFNGNSRIYWKCRIFNGNVCLESKRFIIHVDNISQMFLLYFDRKFNFLFFIYKSIRWFWKIPTILLLTINVKQRERTNWDFFLFFFNIEKKSIDYLTVQQRLINLFLFLAWRFSLKYTVILRLRSSLFYEASL